MAGKCITETELYDQDENSNLQGENAKETGRERLQANKQRTRCQTLTYAVFGLSFLVFGITLYAAFYPLFKHLARKVLVITPDSYILELWKAPPVPIYSKFYFFNITNPEDYPWHNVKLRFQQVGPYIYREYRTKYDMKWNANDTVSYRQQYSFAFQPDMSTGSEDDIIFSINVPHVIVSSMVKSDIMLKWILKRALRAVKSTFVIQRKVTQLLFDGFKDPLVKITHMVGRMPTAKFGYVVEKNGTDDGQYTVYTGVGDSNKLAAIDGWTGKSSDPWWLKYPSVIYGADGSWFPPFLTTSSKLHVFVSELCRTLEFEYFGPSEVHGVTAYRFKFSNRSIGNYDNSYKDECKFGEELCQKYGVHSLSHCLFGAPIFTSLPHFYEGSQWFIDKFDGLNPNQCDHESFIDVQPMIGSAVQLSIKVQFNIYVDNTYFEELNGTMFPMVWVEKALKIDEPLSHLMILVTQDTFFYKNVLSITLIIVGVVFTTLAIFCRLHKQKGRWKHHGNVAVIIVDFDKAE